MDGDGNVAYFILYHQLRGAQSNTRYYYNQDKKLIAICIRHASGEFSDSIYYRWKDGNIIAKENYHGNGRILYRLEYEYYPDKSGNQPVSRIYLNDYQFGASFIYFPLDYYEPLLCKNLLRKSITGWSNRTISTEYLNPILDDGSKLLSLDVFVRHIQYPDTSTIWIDSSSSFKYSYSCN